MFMRGKKFKLSLRKGHTLIFEPNMLVFGSVLERSVYRNTVRAGNFQGMFGMGRESTREKGNSGGVPMELGRPKVLDLLNGFPQEIGASAVRIMASLPFMKSCL